MNTKITNLWKGKRKLPLNFSIASNENLYKRTKSLQQTFVNIKVTKSLHQTLVNTCVNMSFSRIFSNFTNIFALVSLEASIATLLFDLSMLAFPIIILPIVSVNSFSANSQAGKWQNFWVKIKILTRSYSLLNIYGKNKAWTRNCLLVNNNFLTFYKSWIRNTQMQSYKVWYYKIVI